MKFSNFIWIGVLALGHLACQTQSRPEEAGPAGGDDLYTGIEFDMPRVQEPSFPGYTVKITDFGAVGDGLTENTKAFADAIADVAAKGGGKVVIPRGIWLTGPIVLKSNINLHAAEGALVVFSEDKDKYPLVKTSFEGLETYRCQSPISGRDLENVAITGKGTFDGSGEVWRPVKKSKMAPSQWKRIVRSGGVLSEDGRIWYPSESYKRANDLTENFNVPPFETKEDFLEVKEFLRPVMVSLVQCKKVLLDGPTFQNSPAWNIHPLMCEDVTIRNLTVRNPWYSQNGDGLDLESCRNVVIHDNSFDVGDDAICFKSGKGKDGWERGMPTENVIVKNNIVYHGHGGFVVGSEMSGGVKNVHVSHCTFIGTDIGLRFKSTRGRGGVVEDIYISDINMVGIPTDAIRFNLYYGGQSPIPEEGQKEKAGGKKEDPVPVTIETPSFKNITIKNVTSTGSGGAVFIQGLPEMNVKNITMEDMVLESEKGITLIEAEGIRMKNVKVLGEKGPALTIYNGKDISAGGFSYDDAQSVPVVKILGESTKNITFSHSGLSSTQISQGEEIADNTVSLKE